MKKETSDKDKKKQKTVQRVGVQCIFRGFERRAFTTPYNKEAVNMLMNKLDKKGIKDKKGKLVFEFESVVKKKGGEQ